MTVMELFCVLLDGPFLPKELKWETAMIRVEAYAKGNEEIPPYQNELRLIS